MLSDISLGRYYKADSILHRTDPRIKTVLYLVYILLRVIIRASIFFAQNRKYWLWRNPLPEEKATD